MHRYVAMTLVDAHAQHLPNQPGGSDYSAPSSSLSTVSTLTKVCVQDVLVCLLIALKKDTKTNVDAALKVSHCQCIVEE